MTKATPIADSIESRANGSYQRGKCQCGEQITRSKTVSSGRFLHWWHVGTARVYCAEGKQS